jgi:divalent metal cation (Fe/Co/Zn/Cd) transporter
MDIHINVRNDITVKEAHDIAHEVENKLKDIYGEGSIINVHIEPDQLPE